jgi:membrane fusion protein (multidrug efflux system)
MKRTLILMLIALAPLAGCTKKEDTAAATATSKEAPALPADVQGVSAAANSATLETTNPAAPSAAEGAAIASAAGDTVVATGEFASEVRSDLSAKLPGRVAKMFVQEGSRVSKGQPVLELESDYLRINLQRADADVARMKAAEEEAKRDVARKKELIGKESIPQATMDRSQSMFDQAAAGRQSAEAQSSLLRQQIADSTLRSPIDGVVAEKKTDVGQRLGDNTVALTIVQTSPLKLRFRVPEKYLASVRVGQPVKASVDPYPNEKFSGRVSVIGGVIDTATRSLLVETEFPNRDGRLKPGLFARVEMDTK